MDQLRKLKTIYSNEIDAIERLLSDCATDFYKSYNIMSLQGQLYTAKKMLKYGPSSEFHFMAKLIVGGQGGQQAQVAYPHRDVRESLADVEDDDHGVALRQDSPRGIDELRGPGACLQANSIFSSLEGKRVTSFKNQIPVEQVRNLVNWLSKRAPVHEIHYQ